MKGSRFLLLRNADKLSSKQTTRLQQLLQDNHNIYVLYTLKELLQTLWDAPSVQAMNEDIDAWCQCADETDMLYLHRFAKSMRKHRVGISNYAAHRLTSARIEAGNIAIGMIRKRARGLLDTDYFKLKIRQSSLPDNSSMLYGFKPAKVH